MLKSSFLKHNTYLCLKDGPYYRFPKCFWSVFSTYLYIRSPLHLNILLQRSIQPAFLSRIPVLIFKTFCLTHSAHVKSNTSIQSISWLIPISFFRITLEIGCNEPIFMIDEIKTVWIYRTKKLLRQPPSPSRARSSIMEVEVPWEYNETPSNKEDYRF